MDFLLIRSLRRQAYSRVSISRWRCIMFEEIVLDSGAIDLASFGGPPNELTCSELTAFMRFKLTQFAYKIFVKYH